jgi:ribosomal protein S18 acetylase RimI-like enzyme
VGGADINTVNKPVKPASALTRWRTKLRDSDAAAVKRLVTDTGFFSAAEVDVAVELVDEALTRGSASGYEFVFADDPKQPGELLGYACYGPIPATQASYDLYWIAVAPRRQRKGLGARLLAEAEREAAKRGAARMYVDTSGRAQYAPTRGFYERNGYQKAAELEDFYAPGDAKIIYARALA